MDPDDPISAPAFGLLAWRKSAMIMLIVISLSVIECDVYRVLTDYANWLYLYENMQAPARHGISGFPPLDIKADYLSIEAQRFFNVTNPNDWTTANGLWRYETPTGYLSDLCLTPGIGSNHEVSGPQNRLAISQACAFTDLHSLAQGALVGNQLYLAKCSSTSGWMYGSDHNLLTGDEQVRNSES